MFKKLYYNVLIEFKKKTIFLLNNQKKGIVIFKHKTCKIEDFKLPFCSWFNNFNINKNKNSIAQ